MERIVDIRCRLQYLVDQLTYLLEGATVEVFGRMDADLTIDAVSLYSDAETQVESAYLYLCRPEHLRGLNSLYREAVLLCVNNGTPLTEIPQDYHIIVLSCRERLELVFNELQKTIINLKRNNVLMSRAIVEKTDLQEILTIAEKTIKNPFLLLDAQFNLLGWSRAKECSESLYTETIKRGMIPHSYMIKLMERDYLRRLSVQETLVLPRGTLLSDYSAILVMLKEKDMVIGYGCLICSVREVRQPMIHGFEEMICKFKDYLMARSDTSCFSENRESFFYMMMLHDTVTDGAEMENDERELPICVTEERVLHVLMCDDDMPIAYAFKCFLNDVLEDEAAFVYGNAIVTIEKTAGKKQHLSQRAAYHSFLAEYGAVAGISVPFRRIQDIKGAYRQGISSVRMGRKLSACEETTYFDYNRRTYRYADLVPYLMIEREYADTRCLPITCMELLAMLYQDVKKNTDFTHTLFVYLKNNGHIIETAQEMFFHRNSILHRMKQISDSLPLNLSDYMVRDELLFNFRVIDYAKAIGKQEMLMEMLGADLE